MHTQTHILEPKMHVSLSRWLFLFNYYCATHIYTKLCNQTYYRVTSQLNRHWQQNSMSIYRQWKQFPVKASLDWTYLLRPNSKLITPHSPSLLFHLFFPLFSPFFSPKLHYAVIIFRYRSDNITVALNTWEEAIQCLWGDGRTVKNVALDQSQGLETQGKSNLFGCHEIKFSPYKHCCWKLDCTFSVMAHSKRNLLAHKQRFCQIY